MGQDRRAEAGDVPCSNEGCTRPSHNRTEQSQCKTCYNKEWRHKRKAGWVPEPVERREYPCITEGCDNVANTTTKPGLCKTCKAREWYHKKHPDAPRHPLRYHGKWSGVLCSTEGCGASAAVRGLCYPCSSKSRYWRLKEAGTPQYDTHKRRESHLKARYGITAEQYAELFAAQGGRCAICGMEPCEGNTPSTWKHDRLAVDHCHDTGRVRALLCNECNLIVKKRNDPTILRKAVEYLIRHSLDNA